MDAQRRQAIAGRGTRPTIRTRAQRWGLRRRHLVVAAIAVAAVAAWRLPSAPWSGHIVTTRFDFVGRPQVYVVPAGICRIRIEAIGAAGGPGGTAGTPGAGAWATASLAVMPGENLIVRVGGAGGAATGSAPGTGGWNGGGRGGQAFARRDGRLGKAGSGGGGATDVRRNSDGFEGRVIVAGGGSGGAGGAIGGPIGMSGGDGGGSSGHDGFASLGSANPATGGKAGTQTEGGAAGRNAPDRLVTATAGAVGVGGDGASGGISGGGGGGGGLYGGGGGGAGTSATIGGGHGGGGSGEGPPGTKFRTGVWGSYGSGRARISYNRDTDACKTVSSHIRPRARSHPAVLS
jgi:hypothetical protein